MSLWHYTVGARLRSILKDRTISLATEGVPQGERPAVWATSRSTWEPTANKAREQNGRIVSLGKTETAAYGEGLYRIELAPESVPYGWEEYQRLGHIPERTAKSLAQVARAQGSQWRDWRVSFEPIQQASWLRIEVEVGHSDEWTEISIALATAWTRPMSEKGCPGCHTKGRPGEMWRYAPHPDTGEPRALCAACYVLLEQRVNEKRGSD